MAVPNIQGVYSGTSGLVTTSAALATTYTGLVLTNPVNSAVDLVLQSASFANAVAQAAVRTIGLLAGFNATSAVTQTTPAVVVNNFVGGPAGSGLLATAATLPTAPLLMLIFTELTTGAVTTWPTYGGFFDLNDGLNLIIIPPGGYVGFYTSTASTASSLNLGLQWSEA